MPAELIMVKVAPLGKPVTEVTIPTGSTVRQALDAAKSNIDVSKYEDLRKNGKTASMSDVVNHNDIITLVPAIKGGM